MSEQDKKPQVTGPVSEPQYKQPEVSEEFKLLAL
jgi:hypothetical protein